MSSLSPTRLPWTVRVATWSARHRWPVVALWFAATLGVFILSTAAGGTRTRSAVSDDDRIRYESGRARVIYAAAGEQARSQGFYLIVSAGERLVTDSDVAAAIHAIVGRLGEATASVDGESLPVFSDVVDPLAVPPTFGLVSPDRTTVRIVATAPGDGEALDQRLEPMPELVGELRVAYPWLDIHALNTTLANREISRVINEDVDGSLRITIPLTFAILLVAFGALVASFVPLVLAITALLAAFGIQGLYSQLVDPVSPYAGQLIVLIGLAVAVDYSLFMITRFRAERRRGRDRDAAILVASSTAGRAVFFSGLAVMISIAGLFMLDDALFRSMATATLAVVLVSVIGSLTFLPATLAILDRWLDRGRVPFFGRERGEGRGFWASLVGAVMRRPVILAVLTAGVLVVAASPVSRLHIGTSDLSSFPDRIDAVQALDLMNEKWPEGSTLALEVVVTRADEPATQAAIERMSERILALPGVHGPVEARPSPNGTVTLVSFVLAGSQNDRANHDIVRAVRTDVVPDVFGALPRVEALVSGPPAYTFDMVSFYERGIPLVFAFVLGLSFLLLLLAFHSIVIPLKAILLNLLSTGAAYGVLVLVFQEGWLGAQLGVRPGVIEAFVPIFIFTILFGLSMDYHVFILTRVVEARERGLDTTEAVAEGIAITSGTITSAAAIMVAVFAVFATLQLAIIKQFGVGLAVAVLVDATIVRSVLLPATMRLLGDWNWWLPPFLRWLPRVTIEAEPAAELAVDPERAG